jgi:hypothetical protein
MVAVSRTFVAIVVFTMGLRTSRKQSEIFRCLQLLVQITALAAPTRDSLDFRGALLASELRCEKIISNKQTTTTTA